MLTLEYSCKGSRQLGTGGVFPDMSDPLRPWGVFITNDKGVPAIVPTFLPKYQVRLEKP